VGRRRDAGISFRKAGAKCSKVDMESAGRSKGCAGVFLQQRWELCPLSASGYRTASHFVCSQPGNPRITSEDVMESGRRCVCHLNQRNAKGRRRLFAHPADHRAGRKGRSAGICGRVPFFLRKELSAIPAKDAGTLQERKQRRGGDGGKPYPFPNLFHLWAYAGTVYFLYTDGKCVPAFKRQLAVPHGGSMETLPGRNPAL